jgi:PAS domain S-box-containing protein
MLDIWQKWFAWGDEVGPLAPLVYDPWLVALSVLIACAGGVAGMQLIGLARRLDRFGVPMARAAHALAALGLGSGVWGMHFVGMLAVDICQPVRYDPWVTAASMLPTLVASWVGLRLYLRDGQTESAFPLTRVVLGGLWLGGGIGVMHYTGMAAMRMSSTLRYDPVGFVLSIGVAVVLAVIGLGAREALQRRGWRGWPVVLSSGCVLGLATAGMHYTAMNASLFIGPFDPDFPRWASRQWELALAVSAVLVLAYGFVWGIFGLASYRQLAARLRERERLLHDILDHMPIAALRFRQRSDGGFDRVLTSQALAEVTGRSPDSYQAGGWSLLEAIHPQDLPHVDRALRGAITEGEPQRVLVRMRHDRLGWRHVLVIATRASADRTFDVFLLDVTEEQRARAQAQSLLATIDRVIGRAVFDPNGVVREINERLASMLGYTADELRGQPHAALWLPGTEDEMTAFWHRLRSGEPQQGEFVRRGRDGREVYLLGSYQPLFGDDGEIEGVLKLALDITERVRTVQALEEAQQALERALASRSAFFANVSHEIRTPMNAVVGFGELLRERLLPGSVEHGFATNILESARGLLRILNDLLDAAKLERGEFTLVMGPVALPRLLHGLVSQFGVLAAQKGLDLRLDAEATLPTCIEADGQRLRQVLTNLLGNALKFTERGHVTLGAAAAGPEHLLLWVHDTGIGIAPERQQAIFEPFVQADAGTARRYGGTGLGMSIVKQLVALMGGAVALSSEVGVGTRVEVRLPLRVLPSSACEEHEFQEPSFGVSRSLHVLAADDVAQNRELLASLLEREGHSVTAVADGATLLQCYRDAPQAWDVVLLDLHMPGLDGLATCEQLRAFERERGLAPVPVLAVTASVMEADQAAAKRAGMNGFIEKPIDPRRLYEALALVAAPRGGHVGAAVLPSAMAASHAGEPELVDPKLGWNLWGAQWRMRVRQWVEEESAAWDGCAAWDASAWHRVAGLAANLALPKLEQACRACEQAARRGQPVPWSEARQAWRAVEEWLGGQDDAPPSQPLPAPADPRGDLAVAQVPHPELQEVLQRLTAACRRGEVDEAALARLEIADPKLAQALRGAIDIFDFKAALAALDQASALNIEEKSA